MNNKTLSSENSRVTDDPGMKTKSIEDASADFSNSSEDDAFSFEIDSENSTEDILSSLTESENADGDAFSFVIGPESAGERIDKVISDRMPGQSRSYIKKLIKDGNVTVAESGSSKTVKPSAPVKGGETVNVFLPVRMLPDILP